MLVRSRCRDSALHVNRDARQISVQSLPPWLRPFMVSCPGFSKPPGAAWDAQPSSLSYLASASPRTFSPAVVSLRPRPKFGLRACNQCLIFLHVLLPGLPPLRWYLGVPAKRKLVVYSDAQFSTRGRNGVGVTIADTETGLRHTCGAEIPQDILDWIDTFGRKKTKINQCEMLAALVAVMTFPDLFRDRDVLFFVDNVSTLSACVHGYSARPEMGALSNAIHLMFANLGSRTFFQHVPGKANPADIPSRVPFVFDSTDMVLEDRLLNPTDRATVLQINARHRPCVFPLREQLSKLEFFLQFDT